VQLVREVYADGSFDPNPNHAMMPRHNLAWNNRLAPPTPAQAGGQGQYNVANGIAQFPQRVVAPE
jgi:hypothetical protein